MCLTVSVESKLPALIEVLLTFNDIASYVSHSVSGTGLVPALLLIFGSAMGSDSSSVRLGNWWWCWGRGGRFGRGGMSEQRSESSEDFHP